MEHRIKNLLDALIAQGGELSIEHSKRNAYRLETIGIAEDLGFVSHEVKVHYVAQWSEVIVTLTDAGRAAHFEETRHETS